MLLDVCEETKSTPGERVGVMWWEQAAIDLAGARETVTAAEEADRDGMVWKSERGKKRKTPGMGQR